MCGGNTLWMRILLIFAMAWLSVSTWLRAAPAEKHLLYLSTPDGAQMGTASGQGILIFDIDEQHRFVRRIDVPIFKEGLRGLCGNAKRHAVYYTTTNRRLGCFDLETEQVA